MWLSQRCVFSEGWTIKCFLCWQETNCSLPTPSCTSAAPRPHPSLSFYPAETSPFIPSLQKHFSSHYKSLTLSLCFIALNDFVLRYLQAPPLLFLIHPFPLPQFAFIYSCWFFLMLHNQTYLSFLTVTGWMKAFFSHSNHNCNKHRCSCSKKLENKWIKN